MNVLVPSSIQSCTNSLIFVCFFLQILSLDKNMGNFRKWLNLESAIGQKPAQSVMEVLGYLAYDTVREVRRNSTWRNVTFIYENLYMLISECFKVPEII